MSFFLYSFSSIVANPSALTLSHQSYFILFSCRRNMEYTHKTKLMRKSSTLWTCAHFVLYALIFKSKPRCGWLISALLWGIELGCCSEISLKLIRKEHEVKQVAHRDAGKRQRAGVSQKVSVAETGLTLKPFHSDISATVVGNSLFHELYCSPNFRHFLPE